MHFKKFICFVLSGCALQANAQTPEEVKSVFPTAEVVYTNYEKTLTFKKKDGIPVAESEYNIDMMMLTDNNSKMVSRYRVSHSGYSELASLDAYSKIPVKNSFKKIKVEDIKTSSTQQSNIFLGDTKESVFDFPALTQNSIAHLEYTLLHKDAHLITPFFIPNGMPVFQTSYTVVVPNGIYINYIVKNDFDNKFQFTTEKKQKETIYKWTRNNVKNVDDYYTAPDDRYYMPHIIIHVTGYDDKSGKQNFLSSLDDLYKWNFSFTKEINQQLDPSLKSLVDSLTSGVSDPYQKTVKIYKWVQQSIKYIAFENGVEGFRPRNAADVLIKRYGDCKDMASILTQMLNLAGLKGHYTWIGTRDIPYKYSEIPLPIVDNHMISSVQLNGKWYFMDATNPYATLELPPSSIQGKEALIALNDKEYKIVNVPIANPEVNSMEDSTFITFAPSGIKGYEKVNYLGYFGQDVYTSISYRNEKEKEDYVKSRMGKGSNKFILGKFEINRSETDMQHANISAEFEIPDYSKKVGDNYYINLNLEKLMENQAVDLDKRKVPIEHEFKYIIRQHHILTIPDNFKVSFVPEDFFMENEMISIRIKYKVEKSRVIATQEVVNKTLLIEPSQFPAWNIPMKAVMPQYKQSVVLEKQ